MKKVSKWFFSGLIFMAHNLMSKNKTCVTVSNSNSNSRTRGPRRRELPAGPGAPVCHVHVVHVHAGCGVVRKITDCIVRELYEGHQVLGTSKIQLVF